MKRRTLLYLLMSGAVAGPVGLKSASAAAAPASSAATLAPQLGRRDIPKFNGSFLQPWLADAWTSKQWSTEFQLMRTVGIDTLILQWTADSQAQTTVYPSGLAGYTHSSAHDVVGETLHWADRYGIHVYLGLNEDGDWWSKYALDRSWFLDRMSVGRDLLTDLWNRYSQHRSLAGWYIALEPWNSATNTDVLGTLGDGFALVADHAHALTHRPVSVAPFYNAQTGQTPAQWSDTWAALLRRAALDIIALQDGVGATHATVTDLPAWFAATQHAIQRGRPATQLWSDTETYLIANYKTMPINDVVADIDAVAPYVQAITSFSFNHYLSSQQVNPAYYATYREYALTGRLDHKPPDTPTGLTATATDGGGVRLAWSHLQPITEVWSPMTSTEQQHC